MLTLLVLLLVTRSRPNINEFRSSTIDSDLDSDGNSDESIEEVNVSHDRAVADGIYSVSVAFGSRSVRLDCPAKPAGTLEVASFAAAIKQCGIDGIVVTVLQQR